MREPSLIASLHDWKRVAYARMAKHCDFRFASNREVFFGAARAGSG